MKSSIVHAFWKAVDNKGKQIGKQRKILGGSRNEITINLRFRFCLFNNLRIWLEQNVGICLYFALIWFWFLFFNTLSKLFFFKKCALSFIFSSLLKLLHFGDYFCFAKHLLHLSRNNNFRFFLALVDKCSSR